MNIPPKIAEHAVNIREGFAKRKIMYTVAGVILILIIVGILSRGKAPNGTIQTDAVKKQNAKLTVLTTGQVTSSTDLSLSFKASGVVQWVSVKEGDVVKAGKVLANLSQGDQAASLTQARGSLASAQANYDRVLAGASNEEVALAQVGVDSAKNALDNAKKNLADTTQQQTTLINNASASLLSAGLQAEPESTISTGTITISGTYTGTAKGQATITIYQGGDGLYFTTSGILSSNGSINRGLPQSIGNGLYATFSSDGTFYNGGRWVINIPNMKSTSYVTNLNAYNAAVQTQQVAMTNANNAVSVAQNSLDQANATLNLKKAQARPADVAAARAQILSAQGQVQAAYASLENTIIRAPANGTITSVDVKVGELATAQKEAVILQDVTNLHVEADVSEASISQLKPDQTVDVTFDALGPDKHFQGKVQSINPGATVVSGVVNYKVTVGLDTIEGVKPGMTANITILIASKDNILTVPQRAVISQDGKKYVRVIDDAVKKTYHQVEVTTGLQADGGVVEVASGLNEGQQIVTFIKQ